MRRPALTVCAPTALGLALLAAGCAGRHAAPSAPAAQLPPQVVATSPPARSTRVPTDVAIWAQFDRPLDPTTVDTRHVALKVDTRRLPITVSYDASTRRVLIDAGGNLALYSTHTVEFKPGLRAADGDSLGQTYFWQFTTTSVRRPRSPYPADGATGESPFAELLWQGTESGAGAIVYDLYAGTDSAGVAGRAVPVSRVATPRYLPSARWPQEGPDYWSVRAVNLDTGEFADGPVWRFDPLPASTPIDSVVVPMSAWMSGFLYSPSPNYLYMATCNATTIRIGGVYDNFERWDFSALGPGTRLAGASMMALPTSSMRDGTTHGLLMFSLRSVGTLCTVGATQPYALPVANASLGGAEVLADGHLRIQSDALGAFAEAAVRHGELGATLFRAVSLMIFQADASTPTLVLYVYRPTSLESRAVRNAALRRP